MTIIPAGHIRAMSDAELSALLDDSTASTLSQGTIDRAYDEEARRRQRQS